MGYAGFRIKHLLEAEPCGLTLDVCAIYWGLHVRHAKSGISYRCKSASGKNYPSARHLSHIVNGNVAGGAGGREVVGHNESESIDL